VGRLAGVQALAGSPRFAVRVGIARGAALMNGCGEEVDRGGWRALGRRAGWSTVAD